MECFFCADTPYLSSEQVDALKNQTVIQVVAGNSHSLCLTSAGEVFSWGDNSYGQLGRGDPDPGLCRIPK